MTSQWELTRCHESGHAVLACVFGHTFRYLTDRPRSKDRTGHVYGVQCKPGDWLAEGAIHFAGILAEEKYVVEFDRWGWFTGSSFAERSSLHRQLTRNIGRDDMKAARWNTWRAWALARSPFSRLTVPLDLSWSTEDIAIACWRYAALTLAARWDAVIAVHDALATSRRALTYRHVAAIVDSIRPDPDATGRLRVKHLHPWFLDYTRLKWAPPEKWIQRVELDVATQREAAACAH